MNRRHNPTVTTAQPEVTHVEIIDRVGSLVGGTLFPSRWSADEIAFGIKDAFPDIGRLRIQEVVTRTVVERQTRTLHEIP